MSLHRRLMAFVVGALILSASVVAAQTATVIHNVNLPTAVGVRWHAVAVAVKTGIAV